MRRGDFRRVSMTRLLNALPLLLALIFNPAFASIDSDGDGFNDDVDIFPEDAEEWFDSDSDGVGDNADPINNPAELVALSFVNLSDTCSAPKGFVFVLNGVRSPEIPPGTRFVAAVSLGDHVLEHYIDGVFYSQIKKTIYKEKTYLGHGCDWGKYDPSDYPIISN